MLQTVGTTTFLAMVTKFWDSTSKSEIINKTANIIYKNNTTDHRRAVAQHCINGGCLSQWGMPQFDPP